MVEAPMLITRNSVAKLLHASTSGQRPFPWCGGDEVPKRSANRTLYPPATSMAPMQHTSTRKCRKGHHHRVLLGHILEAEERKLQQFRRSNGCRVQRCTGPAGRCCRRRHLQVRSEGPERPSPSGCAVRTHPPARQHQPTAGWCAPHIAPRGCERKMHRSDHTRSLSQQPLVSVAKKLATHDGRRPRRPGDRRPVQH
jgi:hypothetical protein